MKRHLLNFKQMRSRHHGLTRPHRDKIRRVLNEIAIAVVRGDHDLADELVCIDLEDAEHEMPEADR
jgi:hypothetical protein